MMRRKDFLFKAVMTLVMGFALVNCQTAKVAQENPDAYELPAPVDVTKEPVIEDKPVEKKAYQKVEAPESKGVLSEAIRSGSDEQIYKAATGLLSQNPKDFKAINALGVYHYKKGHFIAALYFFNKALGLSPKQSEIYSNIGVIHIAMDEKHDAIQAFRKAIELNPNDGVAAANIGSIYAAEEDYSKALVALEIAYRRGNKDPKILNNYAIALTANGKNDKAKSIYEEALAVQSTNKDLMLNYAILLVDQLGKNQEGLEVINRLKFLGPTQEARNRINILENKAKMGVK